MNIQCKNCMPKEGIEIPTFAQSDKQQLLEWKKVSPLHAVRQLMEVNQFSHINAKYIITHINTEYGSCNRCNFDSLDQENITCPKCGSFNFNWELI